MLRINKKLDYALMSLKFMINKPKEELTTAREICDQLNTPFDTTAKVLQSMNSNGILDSVKGVKGGYSFEKELAEITFLELATIIEGKANAIGCIGKSPCAMHDDCTINCHIAGLNGALNKILAKVTLKDFFENNYNHII